MIVCAGSIEQFEFATPIGVGLVDSAINLTDLVITNLPKEIIFVGTAGSYGNIKPLELVSSTEATHIEISLLQNQSYTPIEKHIRSNHQLPLRAVVVNSSNFITTDSVVAGKYLEKQIEIENMEFFAVLAVAKRFNIPAGGIFCVTNFCNFNAHYDFRRNHLSAMQKLSTFIKEHNIG